MRVRKFNESIEEITRIKPKIIKYFNLFPLLKGLEAERPGIKDRVWDHMKEEWDAAFRPYNGRISSLNLFYYGVGDEYPIKDVQSDEIKHSMKIHPDAFQEGKAKELRLDFNLIWSTYEDDIDDPEQFYVLVNW